MTDHKTGTREEWLAARQMDYQLSSLESRWIGQFDGLLATSRGRPGPADLRELDGREPLIARYFLLSVPGRHANMFIVIRIE